MKIPNEAWVVVADAEKYLVLVNHGDEELIDLRVRRSETHEIENTAEIGADRPGRAFKTGGRRTAFDDTDWKRQEKQELPAELAAMLESAALRNKLPALVIVADPRTLGILRPRLHKAVQDLLLAEIPADYAHRTVPEIERMLVSAQEPAA